MSREAATHRVHPGSRVVFLLMAAVWVLFGAPPAAAQPLGPSGPDLYGYEGDDVPFDLRDIEATGTQLTPSGEQVQVPIGFEFDWYGTPYTEVFVEMRGGLSFTGNIFNGSPILVSPTPHQSNAVAAAWTDFSTFRGGDFYAETRGVPGSREFIAGWYDLAHNFDCCDGTPTLSTFEIILHEGSGDIEFQYAQLVQNPSYLNASNELENEGTQIVIGLQKDVGSDYLNVAYFPPSTQTVDQVVLQEQGYRISSLPEPGAALGTIAGTSLLCALRHRRRPPSGRRARAERGMS